jgi:glycosyltransferase involved in cell wall biosynthesis
MSKISAVIITFNEEEKIERTLNSLKQVADEIIVIDSYSTDNTANICEKLGVKVIRHEWQGFAQTKNFGNQSASHGYILSIDADEVLSEELINSIKSVKNNLYGAYKFNRLTNYCGKWIRHSGWYPDSKVRLFNKHEAEWEGEYLHESLKIKSPVEIKTLQGNLFHYSFRSLSDHIGRINKYSDVDARELFRSKAKFLYLNMMFTPVLKFFKTYFIKLGILDGFAGLCIASFSAIDVFIRYAKVILLRREEGNKKTVSE